MNNSQTVKIFDKYNTVNKKIKKYKDITIKENNFKSNLINTHRIH